MVRDKVKKGGTIIVNPESLIETNPDESAGFETSIMFHAKASSSLPCWVE
jgi:hypothetical protein